MSTPLPSLGGTFSFTRTPSPLGPLVEDKGPELTGTPRQRPKPKNGSARPPRTHTSCREPRCRRATGATGPCTRWTRWPAASRQQEPCSGDRARRTCAAPCRLRHVGEAVHDGLQADGSLERVAGLRAARQKKKHEHSGSGAVVAAEMKICRAGSIPAPMAHLVCIHYIFSRPPMGPRSACAARSHLRDVAAAASESVWRSRRLAAPRGRRRAATAAADTM